MINFVCKIAKDVEMQRHNREFRTLETSGRIGINDKKYKNESKLIENLGENLSNVHGTWYIVPYLCAIGQSNHLNYCGINVVYHSKKIRIPRLQDVIALFCLQKYRRQIKNILHFTKTNIWGKMGEKRFASFSTEEIVTKRANVIPTNTKNVKKWQKICSQIFWRKRYPWLVNSIWLKTSIL